MSGLDKSPQSLAARAIAGFPPAAENGTKAALTTGMTTDRKNFIFTPRRGIMAEIEYPGVAKLVSRLIWVQETGRSSRPTRTKIPLKSLISEGFFLFFVYCGADFALFHSKAIHSISMGASLCSFKSVFLKYKYRPHNGNRGNLAFCSRR